MREGSEDRRRLRETARRLGENYEKRGISAGDAARLPRQTEAVTWLEEVRRVIFPSFFDEEKTDREGLAQALENNPVAGLSALASGTGAESGASEPVPTNHPVLGRSVDLTEDALLSLYEKLITLLRAALSYRPGEMGEGACGGKAEELALLWIEQLPEIQERLWMDVDAALEGDPSASGREEIILSYPGLYAIFVYRVAHELHTLGVPLLPRILSEYAHGRTGIDIHPGARIGKSLLIDHGTGIVIGETAVIGDHVKMYQGVTLGALSTRQGRRLSGVRRHPTIEDHVVLYAYATVLGGETVIGSHSVIGANAFLTESVPAGTRVPAGMKAPCYYKADDV